jgi:hypothetical protein
MGPAPQNAVSSMAARRAYRTAQAATLASLPDEPAAFAEQLHPALFVVWLASVACVGGALYRHEALGTEPTLALMTMVAISWYAIAAIARRKRH